MSKYRQNLPQLDGRLFLTDGGIETTLIFHEWQELPHFAAFHLLKDANGTSVLREYFRRYARIAQENGTGFILESATWRSSPDWAAKLGYSLEQLDAANCKAIELLHGLREEFETEHSPMVVSGCIGPRRDGYNPGEIMTADEAQAYHERQARIFAKADADMITAITMTNVPEAIGITRAAQAQGVPVVISFTVETDGRLPAGQTLEEAITTVDAATANGPAYYMINCAHPTHFAHVLEPGAAWVKRLRGLRANASKLSHAELDNSPELDTGNPVELGGEYRELRRRFPHINVVGGCCGTDHRHIRQICHSCKEAA